MPFGGSSSSFAFTSATDGVISNPSDGQGLIYQSSTSKWKNLGFLGYAALATEGGKETVANVSSSTTTNLPLANGNVFNVSLSTNTTFTFTVTGTTTNKALGMTVYLKQDATGGRDVTWPSSVKWSGGAPSLSTAANSVDIVVFESINGGTTWYGSLVGTNFV